MEVLMLAVVIGLIPAAIAHNKGYNFWMWWAFGAALWIVATPWAILLKPLTEEEKAARTTRPSPLRPTWWE